MSKELEALERIGKLKVKGLRVKPTKTIVSDYNDYFIIETALIEKEQQDGVFKILKEIIEFSQMLPHIEPNKDNGFDIMSAVGINIQRDIENKERELLREWVLKTCFPKELKALKIIKENIELKMSIDEDVGCLYVPLGNKQVCIVGYVKGKEKIDLLKEYLQ